MQIADWTAPLDAVRRTPGDDAATVTAAQVLGVVDRLVHHAGNWRPGDPDIVLVANTGCDGPRLAHVSAGLPIAVLVRMRSDRILRRPTPELRSPEQADRWTWLLPAAHTRPRLARGLATDPRRPWERGRKSS